MTTPTKVTPPGGTGGGGTGSRQMGYPIQPYDITTTQNVKLWADGCCEPRNPGGWGCWGWLAEDSNGRRLADGKGCIGHGPGVTSNVAEYHAGLEALRWAAGQGLRGVTLFMDSQLVVNQSMNAWQCNAAHLWPLLVELRALMAATGASLEWIPRERNGKADQLSRVTYGDAVRSTAP